VAAAPKDLIASSYAQLTTCRMNDDVINQLAAADVQLARAERAGDLNTALRRPTFTRERREYRPGFFALSPLRSVSFSILPAPLQTVESQILPARLKLSRNAPWQPDPAWSPCVYRCCAYPRVALLVRNAGKN